MINPHLTKRAKVEAIRLIRTGWFEFDDRDDLMQEITLRTLRVLGRKGIYDNGFITHVARWRAGKVLELKRKIGRVCLSGKPTSLDELMEAQKDNFKPLWQDVMQRQGHSRAELSMRIKSLYKHFSAEERTTLVNLIKKTADKPTLPPNAMKALWRDAERLAERVKIIENNA